MIFGRKKAEEPFVLPEDWDPATFVDDLGPEDREYEDALLNAELDAREAVEASQADSVRAQAARPKGPWDAEDAPEDGLQRLDLKGLRVPIPDGCEVRIDVGQDGGVMAATLVRGESALQVGAFAAPRSEGIWVEIRAEIAEALRSSGGEAQEVQGPFGPELRAKVPTEAPGQGVVLAPARFLGVDGPRWFLRGLITGPAAVDGAAAEVLEGALRGVVVVRGDDPMAVRDPLPLVLPEQVVESAVDEDGEPAPLAMPERGPEITEVR